MKLDNLLVNQRRDKILELLHEDGSAKVSNLARLFKVTEVTIRQEPGSKLDTRKTVWANSR